MLARAYVLINCEEGFEAQIIDKLNELNLIKEINHPYGSYDIMAKLEAKTNAEINDAINLQIGKIKNIKSSMTMLALD